MGNFDGWTDRWGGGDREWLQTRAEGIMEDGRLANGDVKWRSNQREGDEHSEREGKEGA